MASFTSLFTAIFGQLQKFFFLPQKMICLHPCSEGIINYFAFCPPEPSYSLYFNNVFSKYELNFEKRNANEEGLKYFNIAKVNEAMEFTFAKTKYYTSIACLYYVANPHSKVTIIYSHGNSCDLGDVLYLSMWLAEELKCNVLAYDYSGYGCSTGKPSESQVYADIEAALLQLIHRYGCSFEDVILYGQSLGSAPTLDLASRIKVRGVVIQSGFISALSVPFPKMKSKASCWDQFRNIDRISKVSAPTLIIHGTKDRIVDISHGIELYNNCQTAVEPLWVEGAGHDNIESYDAYMERLKEFVSVQLKSSCNLKCNSHTCSQRHAIPSSHSSDHSRQWSNIHNYGSQIH